MTANDPTTLSAAPVVRRFALEKIHPDANARLDFDPVKLQELADSLKDTKGVLQPLLGMLRPDGEVTLIAGERRLRASALAGFTEVEVKLVETLSRKDQLKWNFVENLQREDLKPLEKATRVKEMLQLTDETTGLPEYNRTSLAAELGISQETVGRYEALLQASEKVQRAVNDDGLDLLIGALIGSLPESMREQAAKEMVFRQWGGPMKREEAQKHVAENYRRDLRKGQFNREDDTLVPDAGACSGCPFFGGNREDVAGKARGYTCLNPDCFDRKQQAHVKKVADTAEENGTKVLGQHMTGKVFQNWNNVVASNCGYVDTKVAPDGYLLKDQSGKKPTWEKILDGAGAPVVIAFDHEGKVRRLVETKVAIEAAKHTDHAGLFKPKAGDEVESADDQKATMQITKAKNKASRAALLEGLGEMFQSFSSQAWSREVRLELLGDLLSNQTKDDLELLCRTLQPDLKSIPNAHAKLKELVEERLDTNEKIDAFILIARSIRGIHFNGFKFREDGYSKHHMVVYCAWAGFDAEGWDEKMKERIKDAEREAKAAIRAKNKPAKKVKAGRKEAQKKDADVPDAPEVPEPTPAPAKKEVWTELADAGELDAQATRIKAGEGYPAVLGPRPAEGTPARKKWEAAKVRIWKEVQKREKAKGSKSKAKK